MLSGKFYIFNIQLDSGIIIPRILFHMIQDIEILTFGYAFKMFTQVEGDGVDGLARLITI